MKQITVNDIHTSSDKLEVFLFNVGQGDHMILKFPTMEYGIIDFHYDLPKVGTPETPCLSYFKELKKELKEEFQKITISFFCISHTDKDHVKGITETIDWFDKEGVFVKDIWLAGAGDEKQHSNFMKDELPALFKEYFNLDEQDAYQKVVELFGKNTHNFFKSFKKWQKGEFTSKRYGNKKRSGEYLVEVRSLPKPAKNCQAINMGPRTTQLEVYFKHLDLDLVKRIFKIKDKRKRVDKNLLSHILRIRFGEVNMLFGGDTHKNIWEECLEYYDNPDNEFVALFKNYDSHFIKVSHHGSKNSSSSILWEKILPKSKKHYLGISAGQHNGYNHPHSETLADIRKSRNNANILSTNICRGCLANDDLEMEYHKWYDDFIENQLNYNSKSPNRNNNEINATMDRTTISETIENFKMSEMGLFAYIFEVPNNLDEEIKVRVALTKTTKSYDCFFNDHQEKLFTCCK